MIPAGRYAFANARARAMKSRLLGRRVSGNLAGLAQERLRRLVDSYEILIASYPIGRELFLALARLHEIENLKLTWRAIVHGLPSSRWRPYWIPLGSLAALDEDAGRDCRSLSALGGVLERTPYHAISDAMRRAHGEDLAAAELGFDRWASRAVADAALSLPAGEHLARDLAIAIVRERDLNVVRRATRVNALPPDAIAGAVAWLGSELGAPGVVALGTWTPADGALWTRLPRGWVRRLGRVADWHALTQAWRHERVALCRRAFLAPPFCLAPGVAVLLMQEQDVRALQALHESGGDTEPSAAVEWVLAAGGLGT
jgi:hypothetical protein